jgi:periplasmic protein TonB
MSATAARADRHLPAGPWARWIACLLLVLAAHAAALLTLRRTVPPLGMAAPDAIMIDLSPEPVTPPSQAVQSQPDIPPAEPPKVEPPPDVTPPEVQPEPEPPPPLAFPDAVPPVPQAEVALPPKPVPKPRPPARPRSQAASPVAPTIQPPTTVAQPAAPSPASGQAQVTWQAQLVAHLARFKRFPPAAQRRGEQGVVLMRLMLSHGGSVLAASMVQGSGYADLDAEAQAWIERAQPLPAAPPGMAVQQVEVTVPLRFTLR